MEGRCPPHGIQWKERIQTAIGEEVGTALFGEYINRMYGERLCTPLQAEKYLPPEAETAAGRETMPIAWREAAHAAET